MSEPDRIWSYDRIHTISMILSSANRLWEEQTFGIATDERTEEIIGKLDEAGELLDRLRSDLCDALPAATSQ